MITLIYAGWLPQDMCPSGAASIYLRESRCSRVSNSRCQGFSFRMPDPRPTARLHRFFYSGMCDLSDGPDEPEELARARHHGYGQFLVPAGQPLEARVQPLLALLCDVDDRL